MKARAAWRPAAALATVAIAPACDGLFRPPDPLDLNPDVVSVAILLVAGESEARLLATHPHRRGGAAPPRIAATLEGPGWTAAFSEMLELTSCTGVGRWIGPAACLRAALPEAIRASTRYGIAGTAPMGSFSGETLVPAVPLLQEPPDTLRLSARSNWSTVEIPVRYRLGAGIGTLLADAGDAFRTEADGTETALRVDNLGYFPQPIEDATGDVVHVVYRTSPVRFSLRLLGLGQHYTNYLAQTGDFPVAQPWPSFGIKGEGVYGYFDGAASSRAAQVYLTPPEDTGGDRSTSPGSC